MFWGAISNTRRSVSLDIQTLRSWLKKLGCSSFFQATSQCSDIWWYITWKKKKLGKITVRYWYVFYCIIGYSYRASKDAGYKTLATLVKHSACQIYQVECVVQLWYKKRNRHSRCLISNVSRQIRITVQQALKFAVPREEGLVFLLLACPSFEAFLEIWTDCLSQRYDI